MGIIVVAPGEKAQRLERKTIERETHLQEYLQNHPDALPVHELKPGAELLVVAREFATESGPIDALAVDGDGDIYVVETKLFKNADKRRVLAQMLDYGAALWSAGPASFLERAGIATDLERRLADAFALNQDEVLPVVRALEANVSAGRIHFVVLMDSIDERLRTLVSFVNQNSSFKVLGVELDFYTHGDLDILIPRLYGVESTRRDERDGRASRRERKRWDPATFYAALEQSASAEATAVARGLENWAATEAGFVYWGEGSTTGSFVPVVVHGGLRFQLFAVRTNGWVEVSFGHIKAKPPFDDPKRRLELLDRLNRIDGVQIQESRIDAFPSVLLETLTTPGALEHFIDAFTWAVGEIRQERQTVKDVETTRT